MIKKILYINILFLLIILTLSCERIFLDKEYYFENNGNSYILQGNLNNISKVLAESAKDTILLQSCQGINNNFSIFNIEQDNEYNIKIINFQQDTVFVFQQYLKSIRASNTLKIAMLDVKQGDSFVISHNSKIAIIDGGYGSRGIYSWQGDRIPILKNYLLARNKKNLEFLLATHNDLDHYGGLLDIVNDENFSFKEYINGENCGFEVSYKLSVSDDLSFDVVYSAQNKGNDESLVLMLNFFNFNMLFTADISGEIENIILEQNTNLECEILKVSHHGSNSSSIKEFLDKSNAFGYFISSGKNNPYNHPSPEVIERIKKIKGADIFRTDLKGHVFVYSDGYSYQIYYGDL